MSAWPEEKVALLKTLWQEGFSASIISARLGDGVTRSAVLGKIHRMGQNNGDRDGTKHRKECVVEKLGAPAEPVRRTPTLALVPRRPVVTEPRVRRAPPPPIALEAPVPTGKITIAELSDKTCKWPIGEPGASDFHFCGHPPDPSSKTPYCPFHARLAIQPIQPKKYSATAFVGAGRRLANVG